MLFWAGFAAWHIFGILMDNGAKHKFWDVVIFPVQPQRSLIAANLEIQQYKRQVLVPELQRRHFTLMFNSHTGRNLSTKGKKILNSPQKVAF